MGEALNLMSGAATQGEFACKPLNDQEVEQFWPEIAEELQKVHHIWDHWWTLESLYIQVATGGMQVWVAGKPPSFNLVTFTQLCNYPANTILQIVIMFGERVEETLPVVMNTLEHYAEMRGCRYMEAVGRPGWKKFFERYGARQRSVVFEKPLGEFRRH